MKVQATPTPSLRPGRPRCDQPGRGDRAWPGGRLADASRRKGRRSTTRAWREFEDGAVGTLVLSHAPFFRKGIAPELGFGTKASLGIDRVSGNLTLAKPDEPVEIIDNKPDNGFGIGSKIRLPSLRQAHAGEASNHRT